MSTRLYPVFRGGRSKLRVFLPNFWMKLVKPEFELLPNQVQFVVSQEMTRLDVKQYLEKIYKIPVVHVSTFIKMGATKSKPNFYITKEPDEKIAFVTMPKDQTFQFPDLFANADKNIMDSQKSVDEAKTLYEKKTKISIHKQGVPTWFSY